MLYQITGIVGGTKPLLWTDIPKALGELSEDHPYEYRAADPAAVFRTRIWDFGDNPTFRYWRGIYSERTIFRRYFSDKAKYLLSCRVRIEALIKPGIGPVQAIRVNDLMTPRPGETGTQIAFRQLNYGRVFVELEVKNEGTVPLIGYKSGLIEGMAAVTYVIYDLRGKPVFNGHASLYTPETIRPGETGLFSNILRVEIPRGEGEYELGFDVAINGVGSCQTVSAQKRVRLYID